MPFPCASVFTTPWLSLGDHGARRFFDPLPAIPDDALTTGLGLVLPAFKFLNGRTNVNLYPTWYAPKAAFVRNDRLLALKAVESVVCVGSGIQMNLAQKLRLSGHPIQEFHRDINN